MSRSASSSMRESSSATYRPVAERLRTEHDRVPTQRDITVLVAEVASLAPFGTRLDTPGVAALADQYLSDVTMICATHGGIVDGLAAGRLSVLFGSLEGESSSRASLAAFRTAIELRERTKSLVLEARRRGLRAEPPFGIGIASGTCDVGVFGGEIQKTFTAIGVAPAARRRAPHRSRRRRDRVRRRQSRSRRRRGALRRSRTRFT